MADCFGMLKMVNVVEAFHMPVSLDASEGNYDLCGAVTGLQEFAAHSPVSRKTVNMEAADDWRR